MTRKINLQGDWFRFWLCSMKVDSGRLARWDWGNSQDKDFNSLWKISTKGIETDLPYNLGLDSIWVMTDLEVICITLSLVEAADAQRGRMIYPRYHFWVVGRLTKQIYFSNEIHYNSVFCILFLYTQGMSQYIIHLGLLPCLSNRLMLAFNLIVLHINYPYWKESNIVPYV